MRDLMMAAAGLRARGPYWAARWAALGLLVLAWFLINGYRFGVFDQSIHLPFLMRELDPSYLRGDVLVDAYAYHPSLFWKLQALLARFISIETLYLGIHVLSVAAMLAGTAAIARALMGDKHGAWADLLAPLLALTSKQTLAAVATMDPLVLNRTVAIGPQLFALALGIQRRYHAAFLLIGLAFLIHPTSSLQAAFLVWLVALFDREHRRAALTGPLVCIAAASPLLLMMVRQRSAGGVPFPAPDEWEVLTRVTVGLHHYPSDWWWGSWLLLLMPLLTLVGALRTHRSRPVELYILAVALLSLAGALGTEVLRLPTALHLHLLQSTRFLSYLAMACGARWILETWPVGSRQKLLGWLVAVSVLVTQFQVPLLSFVFLAVLLVLVFIRPERRESPASLSLMAVASLTVVLCGAVVVVRDHVLGLPEEYRSRLQPGLAELKGARLMRWARQHLPPDAVVAIPPYFQESLTSFRYGAARPIVGTYKDGGEASFSLTFMRQWRERMEALCDCRPFDPAGRKNLSFEGALTIPEQVLDGYRKADAARFGMLADRFGATHAVIEVGKAREPDLPLEYADEEYKLYRIPPPDARRAFP
jgi:hypothetical protein